jgi:hypothetical protein
MFLQLVKSQNSDDDYPERMIMIEMLTRVLEGTLYDHISTPFCVEYGIDGQYVQLRDRRPSVKINICRTVIDNSVSLVFGSDHFPKLICKDKNIEEFAADIIEDTKLNLTMIEGCTYGSVGSIVFLMRILEEKIFWEVKKTQYLTPVFKPNNPKELLKITEKYKVPGFILRAMGYTIDEPKEIYWYMCEWTETQELYYIPWKVSEKEKIPQIDKNKTINHALGFVPMTWVKDSPKPGSIDGGCRFFQAIDTNIEIDYQLSQGGRGLKYSSDPCTVLKLDDPDGFGDNNAQSVSETQLINSRGEMLGFPPASGTKKVIKSANNALVLGKEDDAELLEISGNASRAIGEYVRLLRELGIESIHGNRANADKVNAAQSGEAQKQLNQALIWLADNLRIVYGDAMIRLIAMAIKATLKYRIIVNENIYSSLPQNQKLELKWPHWYPSTSSDKLKTAQTLDKLTDSALLSKETATKNLADDYGISDVKAEQALIEHDQQKLAEQQPSITETIPV